LAGDPNRPLFLQFQRKHLLVVNVTGSTRLTVDCPQPPSTRRGGLCWEALFRGL
jgi:hypothetical protein